MSLSKRQITADLRAVAGTLGHSPTSVEYARLGRYHVRTVQRRFNQKWPEIINGIGLRYCRRTFGPIVNNEELKKDLKRVANQLGHPPTKGEYAQYGRFDPQVMQRRSGLCKWEEAAAVIGGFQIEEIKLSQARGGIYHTTTQWLKKVRELSLDLGHAPTTAEANAVGINAHQLCMRVGGKWTDVLMAANVDLKRRKPHAQLLATSTEAIIDDVVRVSRRLGRPAKAKEYERSGHYSSVALAGRLGGWKQVKKLVAQRLSHGAAFTLIPDEKVNSLSIQSVRRFFNKHSAEISANPGLGS